MVLAIVFLKYFVWNYFSFLQYSILNNSLPFFNLVVQFVLSLIFAVCLSSVREKCKPE